MAQSSLWRAALGVLVALAFAPLAAGAAVGSVTVDTSRPYEGHGDYTFAEITIQGTVSRPDGSLGHYTVPAVLLYPRPDIANRVGVVDWLNSSFYHFFPPSTEFATFQFTLLSTGDFLFDEGYTYLSIQWNKAVTEIFGAAAPTDGQPHNHLVYGSIDRSADAWEILLDAARLLKDPSALASASRPARVRTVLSSGYSQGAALQLEVLADNLDPTRVYDGHLAQMIGRTCWKREDVAPHFGFLGDCGPLPRSGKHAPVIVLTSETDMVVYHPTVLPFGKSAFFVRNARNPRWRQYEMAGVSHLPEPIFSLGLPNQNTADARPIFRAALQNLTRWTHGPRRVAPPASRFFEGRVDATGQFIPRLDADGHFTGGVRLPHVESRVHGKRAGAPLGRHRPVNPAGQDPFHPFVLIGGTFTCFVQDELDGRYPSHQRYVRLVKRSADALAAQRYIGSEDSRALVAEAARRPVSGCDDDGADFGGPGGG
jgi:hypothetical protein